MINTKRIMSIVILLFIVASFTPGIYRSFVKVSKLERELKELKNKQYNLEERISNYEKDIEDLKNTDTKEKVVRNKLQMVKPGEIIYRVTK